ncbi:type IIG restriction enzyme/methyltransferase [Helicobacter sp. T3_23-1056]
MLKFNPIALEDINATYAQEPLEKTHLSEFANIIASYQSSVQHKLEQNLISTKYTERNLASNELAQLFNALGFECQSEQESGALNANSAIDLALIKRDTNDTSNATNAHTKVIIEAKLPENLTKNKQMFSPSNVNCKALHEAILYYLREVWEKQNYGLESIIITDFTRFFIFSYKEFDRLFLKNSKIKEAFSRYKNDTSSFYAKAKDILDVVEGTIYGIYIDLESLNFKNSDKSSTTNANKTQNTQNTPKDAKSIAQSNAKSSHQNLTPALKKRVELLCKIFHKDFLFSEFSLNNPLSPRFYNELLYILGLAEYTKNGKILILPSKESKEGRNTLYHLIFSHLQAYDKDKANDLDFVMQYIILWLNRILFLKLIEANLVRFNDDTSLAFLNKSKLKDYQALSHLFFEILAKAHNKRDTSSPLAYLPHLNSSLFEKQECEEILEISMLDNNATFAYYPTTQVKKDGKTKAGSVNLLDYIFEFLDSFDYGSGEAGKNNARNRARFDGFDSVESSNVIEQKELIKTNVLGLVFEKLNGYKEGSYYTPNFITSYMCRVSLEQVIVEKFNEANPKWNAKNFDDLRELIRDERERKEDFKKILREVKICDPSVGSGHFLVSVLCEMVRIYHYLRLSDELNEYELKIEDDEIIIYVAQDKVFDYRKPTKPNDNNQTIQKTLFHLKKSIIEHNLFGVDINPNSVEICKLRLWIELLKNSYYLTSSDEGYEPDLSAHRHQMQTLPNIDINIKCGNSLISRFALQDSLRHIPNIDKQIKDYQKLVFEYKHSSQSELKPKKKDIESKIQNLKATFRLTLKDPKTKQALEKALKNHIRDFGNFLLDDDSLLDGLSGRMGNLFAETKLNENEQAKAAISYANIKLLRHRLDSALSGDEYKGAFEWRFEFPEVLDSNGDFMGFDLIIGNPPYGNLNKDYQKQLIESTFPHSYFGEISSNFAELAHNLIKQKARFSFVTSYALTFSLAQSGLRNLLHSNYKNIQISSYDRDGSPQFDKMSQSVSILFAHSKGENQKAIFKTSNFVRQKIPHEELEFSPVSDLLLIDSELGSDFATRHRIPKIGGEKNLELLCYFKKLPHKLGDLFGGDESLYIRTSGNYWYNAFLEIPYQSTEIKSFSVKNKYFVFCLINSNVYYWWLRIYGDGRHNNKDIMDSFRLPKMDLIEKHNDLWEKLALNHWAKMQSVFNAQHNFFATSQIKDCVDMLDYHICLKVLGFDMKTLKYICDYDKNIRGGLKCNFRKLEAELKAK